MATITYGWEEKFFVVPETAFGEIAGPGNSLATGMKILTSEFSGDRERLFRDDKNYTRSQIQRILGRWEGTWRMQKYLIPHGNPGYSPDDNRLLRAAFGQVNSTGEVQVGYFLTKEIDFSHTLWRGTEEYAEAAVGAIVNEVEFRIDGRNFATVEYRGLAKRLVHTGVSTLSQVETSGVTTIHVVTPDSFSVGSFITIGTSDNNGQGYEVTNVNSTDGTLTISPALDSVQDSGAKVKPFWPIIETHGSPIPGTLGTLMMGTNLIKVRTGTVTLTQNIALLNDEYGTDSASAILNNALRNVNFSFDLVHRTTYDFLFGMSLYGKSYDMKLQIGTETGRTVEIHLPNAEFDRPSVDIPEKDVITNTLSGTGLMIDGEDEIEVFFK